MITDEGKRICDKEIRNRDGQWVGCRAPAPFATPSKNVPHMDLHFCARHTPDRAPTLLAPIRQWQPKPCA